MLPLHPANAAFPMMTDGELEELAESIKAIGLLDPIVLDKHGALLDGKCRLRACEIAGIEPRFETFEGDEERCRAFVWSANGLRCSYTPSQKAMVEAIAAARMHAEGADCYWDHRVLPEARIVARHPDLTDSVMKGMMGLSTAYDLVLERQKETERRAVEHQRLEAFRKDEPYWAVQVDEGTLTLDQALAAAGEQRAAPALAEHAEAIRVHGRRVIADIIETGRRLTECKALLGHGNWLPWLKREFGWGESTALNFMRVYRVFGTNSQHVADLELPANVFYLLAAPSTSAVIREEILERAQRERVSLADVRKLINNARPDKPTRDRFQELRDLIAKMSRELPDDLLVDQLRTLLQ